METKLSPKARAAILVAADTPAKVRASDAFRVYDEALKMHVVDEVKAILRAVNPAAFDALCQYEGEEIEAKLSA